MIWGNKSYINWVSNHEVKMSLFSGPNFKHFSHNKHSELFLLFFYFDMWVQLITLIEISENIIMGFFEKIMSVPLWVKFRNGLGYVFGFHDICLSIWSGFQHLFSEQYNIHINFLEHNTIHNFVETEIDSILIPTECNLTVVWGPLKIANIFVLNVGQTLIRSRIKSFKTGIDIILVPIVGQSIVRSCSYTLDHFKNRFS